MKRFLTLIGILLCALAILGARSSGEKTSDAAVMATPGQITGAHVITDGTNNAKIIVYDNASAASGTVILERTVSGVSHYGYTAFGQPVDCYNGIYVDVTGTGASYIIEYIAK